MSRYCSANNLGGPDFQYSLYINSGINPQLDGLIVRFLSHSKVHVCSSGALWCELVMCARYQGLHVDNMVTTTSWLLKSGMYNMALQLWPYSIHTGTAQIK